MQRIPILLLTISLALPALAQSPDVLLRAAIDKEQSDGDLKGAISAYQKILDSRSAPRDVKAKALLHQADCHSKLGNQEARKLYEKLLKEYADQSQVAGEAQSRIAAMSGGSEPVEKLLLSGEKDEYAGSVSRDGRYMAYWRQNGYGIGIHDTVSGKHEILPDTALRNYSNPPLISPDGAKIAYGLTSKPKAWRGYQIYLADRDGKNAVNLTPAQEFNAPNLSDWHPMKSELLIASRYEDKPHEIVSVDINRKSSRVLFTQPNSDRAIWTPKYTSDGKHIVFTNCDRQARRGECQLDILPSAGGAPVHLPVPLAQYILQGVTADNQLIYISNIKGQNDLWSLRLKDGKADGEPVVIKRNLPRHFWIGVDNKGSLYYTVGNNRAELYSAAIDPSTGNAVSAPTQEKTLFPTSSLSPAYSPDGRFLSFICGTRENPQLRIRDLSNGSETPYPLSLTGVIKMRWLPDGKSLLLFSQGGSQAGFYRYDLASKNVSSVFLFDDGQRKFLSDAASTAVVAPDGQSIVFKYRNETTSFVGVYPIAGGTIRNAYSAHSPSMRMFALSPDGSTIVLGLREGERDMIALMPFSGGQPKIIYRYPDNEYQRAWGALAFTADGKHILFQREVRDGNTPQGDETWTIPVEGGTPRKLFQTHIVRDYAIHPDGRTITLSTNYGYSDTYVLENLVKVGR